MFHSSPYKLLAWICLICTMSPAVFSVSSDINDPDRSTEKQIQIAAVIVSGRTLSGPNSTAQRRTGRIFVPISAVARALGDVLEVDASARIVKVWRQTGANADFDARIGQVREDGAVVLSVSNAGAIAFAPNADGFLLPAEIAAALFDISITYDSDKNAVIISRGKVSVAPTQTKSEHGAIEIYQADYEYNLNKYNTSSAHDLGLTAIGRLGDGRFTFASNSNYSTLGFAMRRATFALERPNGQKFIAGDFGTGAELQFLSANVRGGSASIPIGKATVTAFGGRSYSGVAPIYDPLIPDELQDRNFNANQYDTNIFGVSATTRSPSGSRRLSPLNFSGGAMRFRSPQRDGDLVTGSVNYDTPRFRLQSDIGYGKFSGNQRENGIVDGFGAAFDVSATYQLLDNLAVQGRFTKIGKNFISPQAGLREPLDLKAAGVTWSPAKWLSTSFNASTSSRPGTDTQNNKYVTASVAVTPTNGAPRFYLSHTQSETSQIHSGAYTTLNASKEFSRLRLYLNATRIKNLGPASVNAQLGANYAVSDRHSFEVYQGVGTGGSYNGQYDWRVSNLFSGRLSFTAGAGYNYSASSGTTTFQRVSASLVLPRQTSLQVNYYQTAQGPTLLVSLRGSLFRKKSASGFLNSPTSQINSYGKISGRVYQDVNQNGKFDEGIDKPQPKVQVRVDGNRYVESDENGFYRFDSIMGGDHKVYLDLLSVRADLTLLGDSAQDTLIKPGHDSNFDFRLVRTGRITGRVWFDKNENGVFDEGETPLADVRVVTASGRDTLTDMDGVFTIADLAPGEHIVLLDEKTLPEKTVPAAKPLAVQVFAGRETSDLFFAVIQTPAEVKNFTSAKKVD